MPPVPSGSCTAAGSVFCGLKAGQLLARQAQALALFDHAPMGRAGRGDKADRQAAFAGAAGAADAVGVVGG